MERPADFGIAVEGRTITVHGEVDAHTAPQLAAAIDDLGVPLEIDATRVSFMDSSGLSALLRAARMAHEAGGRVALRPSDAVRRLVGLTGLDSTFDLAG